MEEMLKEISDSLKSLHGRMDGIEQRLERLEEEKEMETAIELLNSKLDHLERKNISMEKNIAELLQITKEGQAKEDELIRAGLEALLEIAEMLGNATKMIARLPKKIMSEAIEDIDYEETDKWNIENPTMPKKFGRVEKYIDPETKEVKTRIKSYTLREAIGRLYDMSKFLEKANKDLIDIAQTQKLEGGEQHKVNLEVLKKLELILAKQLGMDITQEKYFKVPPWFDYRLSDSGRVMKNRAIDTIKKFNEETKKDMFERMKINKDFLLGSYSRGYRRAYSEEVEKNETKKIKNLQRFG